MHCYDSDNGIDTSDIQSLLYLLNVHLIDVT